MTVAITSITKAGPYAWRYQWTGNDPYDIYHEGRLIADQTTDTEIVLNHTDDEEPPALEIRDDDSTGVAESVKYSPIATLQWRGNSAWQYYKIEYNDSGWEEIGQTAEDGSGYYQYSYGPLDDGAQQFRVTPYDERGYAGYPLQFDVFIRRNPPAPVVDVTYDSGTGDITIAARS